MAEPPLPGPTLTDLRLDQIGAGQWRVCDRRFRESNAMTLLGFVQQVGDQFEVTRICRPNEAVLYASLPSAMDAFLMGTPQLHGSTSAAHA
jgi:hypothetical protein